MKLKTVQFVHTVSFGGQLQSISTQPVGDRPGQGGADLELVEVDGGVMLKITKIFNGQLTTRYVPMTNIASFEPAAPVTPATMKK